jgi:glycosyltransferase involved in cell wall biosynthesis
VVVPNGFDPDDWARAARLPAPAEEVARDRGHFVILHAGQLAHRPTAIGLLGAVRRLLDERPARSETIRLRFMGGNEGLDAAAIERARLGPVVDLLPSRPHLEAMAAMRRASLLVLLGHGGDGDSLIYTGKIYEYLSSGRPVLGILGNGPAAQLLHRTEGCSVCQPGEEASIFDAIHSHLERFEAGNHEETSPLRSVPGEWERPAQAMLVGKLLDSLLSEP